MAKGYRTKEHTSPLIIPAEYNALLYEPQEQGLWLLNELTISKNLAEYPHPSSWAAALCGVELISYLITPASDHAQVYDLLLSYLDYLAKLSHNGILIFWRFFIRICALGGIGHPLENCSVCHKPLGAPVSYCHSESGFICAKCLLGWQNANDLVPLSPQAKLILSMLPEIGNYLDSITITRSVCNEVNQILRQYWGAHTKQTLNLKSMSVLIQFYL